MATEANLLEGPRAPVTGQQSPVSQIVAGFAEAFRGMRRAAADRSIMSTFLSFLLALCGFGAFYLAYRGASATLVASVQIPYIISGGLAGFALLGLGLGIWHTQISRRMAAREDVEWALLLDHSLGVLEAIKAENTKGVEPDDHRR